MISELDSLPKNEMLKILAVVILSDGYLCNKEAKYLKLSTCESADCQHVFFSFLCKKIFLKDTKRYVIHIKRKNGSVERYLQSNLFSKEAVCALLELNPTYLTTSKSLSGEEFLKLDQPDISFLLNSNEQIKLFALRTWFDFDGSISPFFKLKRKTDIKNGRRYTYYQVQFECEIRIAETNPALVAQLNQLFMGLGFDGIIKKKNNWSGIDGICISKIKDVKRFVRLGPITDVKISKKSNRFEGIPKKNVCIAVKKILDDSSILKSRYFKGEREALLYKKKMDLILLNTVKRV